MQTRYPDLDEPEPAAEDARRAITQAAVQQAIRRDLETHSFPFEQRQQSGPERALGTVGPEHDNSHEQ